MNRSQLALTIKSRIPREITADRAVGAGAGARDRDGAEDEDRQQQKAEGTRGGWWDGSSISNGRQASGRWPFSWAARWMTRSAGIQDRTGSRSAAMRETEKEFSTRLCLLRRCGGHTTAGELACWLGWKRRRRRGCCEAKGHDTIEDDDERAQQQQQGRCLAVSEQQRCDTRVIIGTAFDQLLAVPIAWEAQTPVQSLGHDPGPTQSSH
jgi:hypothetical protein